LVLALDKLGRLHLPYDQWDEYSRILPVGAFVRSAFGSANGHGDPLPRFVVTDDPSITAGRLGRILLDYDYFSPIRSADMVIAPFYLHPDFYAKGIYRTLERFRGRPRTMRLFFAGTANTDAYSRSFDANLFPMMDRPAVLSAIEKDFAKEVLVVRRREDLSRIDHAGPPIVLIPTDRTEDNLAKHLVSPKTYLQLLSTSAFALCPPGWIQPLCHNLIESLAVGAIPVLSYANYFDPPLLGGKNCLVFRDRDELRMAVRAALSMTNEEIAQFSAAAVDYYDSYLSVDSLAGKLGRAMQAGGDIRVRFNAGGVRSVKLLREHRPVGLH
jgi:hypothetical protein